MQVFPKIRSLVMKIPVGFVTTYGTISKVVGTSPRVVGWALRGNENMNLPCHRVVKSGGVLADNFSLGNWPEQRRRLEAEGIKFDGQKIVDFKRVFFDVQ